MSMKTSPHPDRSSEAAHLRDDLSHQPEALRALDTLAREETTEAEIPPIPEDLRDQWQDRYGRARQPIAAEKKSWLTRFSGLWTYGTATALAAIAIFFVLQSSPPVTPTPDKTPILRGGNDYQALETKLIVFIPSETISFQAFAATRPENSVVEAKNSQEAEAFLTQNKIKNAAILHAKNATLTQWNGQPQKALQLIQIQPTTDEYDLSEALDNYLKE